MKKQRQRFSDTHAPGPRLTWQALSLISLVIGVPVALVLEMLF